MCLTHSKTSVEIYEVESRAIKKEKEKKGRIQMSFVFYDNCASYDMVFKMAYVKSWW